MLSLLWIIGIVLLVLWLLGLFAFHAGGLIYILLVVAIIMLIIWLAQRGRTGG
ncbi:MAG: lmo0937 family membrane protein [Dehalococcoidia bacterium]|nr:lmo0937 family membrane protein [Dehalococcoidia bacterium]